MPTSPRTQSGGTTPRAPLMRRESSQQSHNSKSPGSAGDQPLRHTVKPAKRHIVLPRNHNSARNLQKLQRQAQANHATEEGRKNSRQKSHEGDTEIRLPGSLDDSQPPAMKRNLTASQLPRNTSHTKLKKNLSHGQLTRLGSGKNLSALNNRGGPPSPGLKGRKKRPKSADFGQVEKDLHTQEVELAQQQQDEKNNATKHVGFALGSSGDSEGENDPDMEGSGMQEDEWTDQSASASPFSTRQNTANNSRRASMIVDKPPDKAAANAGGQSRNTGGDTASETNAEAGRSGDATQNGDDGDEQEDDEEPPSPRSMPHMKKRSESEAETAPLPPPSIKAIPKSPLHAARDAYPSPATQRLLSRNHQNPAPAQVSNVSAMDHFHSARASPAASLRSSKSNIAESNVAESGTDQEDELVSRFIPSASHPSVGSGGNTAMNTPKIGSFHTPENDSTLAAQHRDKPRPPFQLGPTSPGSTISGSSGATTPAMQRSRTELRMMNEKAMAEREDAAKLNPIVPPHVFDRRNESLKSWINLERLGGDGRGGLHATTGLMMGPELFQGRFKAVNTELKVVQRFRDPVGDSVSRLQACRGQEFTKLRAQRSPSQKQASPKMPISKSAVSLSKRPSKLSTSTSPPKSASPAKPAITNSKSTTQLKRGESRRGKVTFSQTPPETREVERSEEDVSGGADAIAREMWDSVL